MKIKIFPLPLAGEGGGEGGLSRFPLTSFLSPEGIGELRRAIFFEAGDIPIRLMIS
jgi:hypothetical protein